MPLHVYNIINPSSSLCPILACTNLTGGGGGAYSWDVYNITVHDVCTICQILEFLMYDRGIAFPLIAANDHQKQQLTEGF